MKNLVFFLSLIPFVFTQTWHEFESNEYFVGQELVGFSTAKESCENMSAILAIIGNEETRMFLTNLFQNLTGKLIYYL